MGEQLLAVATVHGDMHPAWEAAVGTVGTVETAPDAWNCGGEDGELIYYILSAKGELIDTISSVAVRGLASG